MSKSINLTQLKERNMKSKFISLIAAIVALSTFVQCGETDDSAILIGTWLASDVSRRDCNLEIFDGPVNCSNNVGSGNSFSCVRLELRNNGNYVLNTNFDSQTDDEVGTFNTTDNGIRLCPIPSTSQCRTLTIVSSTSNLMTVEFPREDGCIAVINLVNIST